MAKKTTVLDTAPLSRIYIGPTMHRRAIMANTLFLGELPDYVTALIAKVPEVATMIIDTSELATARKLIQEAGTEYHRLHQYLLTVRFDGNGEVRA